MNKILPRYVKNEIQIEITGDWNFINTRKDVLKQYYYRWKPDLKVWYKPIMFTQEDEIKKFIKNEYLLLTKIFIITEIDIEMFKYSIKSEFKLEDPKSEEVLIFDDNKLPENLRTVLMSHQKLGIAKFIKQNNKILLAWSMGTGKTLGSTSMIKYFDKKALIILPLNLILQWKKSIIEWKIGEEKDIFIYDGNYIDYTKKFYIFNYEKFRFLHNKSLDSISKKEREIYDWIKSINHEEYFLIYDEMYKIKNYKSQLFKAHQKLRSSFHWFGLIGLTGTPLENTLMDFYTILNFIEPFCITWQQMEKYFMYKINEFITKFRNLKYFNELASKVMHRVLMEDVRNDLPELTQDYRFVKNSKEAHRVADLLKSEAEFGIFEIYTTLKTFDSYFKPKPELKKYELLKDYEFEHKEKFDELTDILEEIGDDQILIFTQYSTTAKWLKDKLKSNYKVEIVTGENNIEEKENIKTSFIDKRLQIVIATSVWTRGQDFPHINYLCNWDLPFNPSEYQQRIFRIFRLGSNTHKVIINLVSDIIEKDVYEIIKHKLTLSELAVEGTNEKDVIHELSKKWGIADKRKENI